MMKFWTERDAREKLLIGIALGLAALVLGGQFILKPLLAYPGAQKTAYESSQSDLDIMRKGQAVLKGYKAVSKTLLSPSDAQSKVTKSAAAKGLVISRRQPNGETGLSLWFENAESTLFYNWIDELTSSYNITLLRANINRNDDGTIRAQITFKLGA